MENIVPRNDSNTRQYTIATLQPLIDRCKPPLRSYLIWLGIWAVGDSLNTAAAVTPFVDERNLRPFLCALASVFPLIIIAAKLAQWLRRWAQQDRAGLSRRVTSVNRVLLVATMVTHITCAFWCAELSQRGWQVLIVIAMGGMASVGCFFGRLELLTRQSSRWGKIRVLRITWTGIVVALGVTQGVTEINAVRAVVVAALLVNMFADFHEARKFLASARRLRDYINAGTIAAESSSCGNGPSIWRTGILRRPDSQKLARAPDPSAGACSVTRSHTSRPPGSRKVILFLAADPGGTGPVALNQECAAIERELRLASKRDFEFCSKWFVSVDDFARYVMEYEPAIIHFSGHGACGEPAPADTSSASRDVVGVDSGGGSGILLHAERGGPQLVTARALAMMLKSMPTAPRLVLLNACYSQQQADELCTAVDCVVGMTGPIRDDSARTFAVGFYRALGNGRSVANAVEHAVATMAAKQLPDEHLPRCQTRDGLDASQLFLNGGHA